jgi:hypothetical protein
MDTDEQQDLQQLLRLFADTDMLVRRINGGAGRIEPEDGSPLAGDDRRASKFGMSGAAWNHFTVAVDHLSTLRSATVHGRGADVSLNLQLNGQFTLLRAVIENASAVLWLLGPAARSERILRRLQFAAGDIRNNEAIKVRAQQPGGKTKEQRLDEVRAIATACGLDSRTAVRGPGYEDIVQAAGEATEVGADLAVILWRACSGLAHGDFWASITLPSRAHLAATRPGMANLELTPNVRGLCTALMAAKIMLAAALRLYDIRCTPAMRAAA